MTPRHKARTLGAIRYVTNRPCCRGHISERLVSNGSCIQCMHLSQAHARINNLKSAQARRSRAKKWKKDNSVSVAAYQKKWNLENKKTVSISARNYKDRNAVQIAEKRKRTTLSDLIWASAGSLRGGLVTRVRRLSLPCDQEMKSRKYISDWIKSQPNCECCGVEFDLRRFQGRSDAAPSIDRFYPLQGYTKANSALICYRCNALKSNATNEEVRRLADWMDRKRAIIDGGGAGGPGVVNGVMEIVEFYE